MGRRFLALSTAALAALLAFPPRGAPAGDGQPSTEQGFLMFDPYPAVLLEDDYLKRIKREGATGVLVIEVVTGGPADLAGVKEGDALLQLNGTAVEVPADVDGNDPHAGRESFEAAFAHLTDRVKAGAKIPMVVERDGKELSLEATAVGDEARVKIQETWDEQNDVPKVPVLSSAGVASPSSLSFDKAMSQDKLRPDECLALIGDWEVDDDGVAAGNRVLRQKKPLHTEGFLLVAGPGRSYGNGTVSARVRMDAGGDDTSAGLVFRAKDHKNHYAARVSAKDGQFRLVVVADGKPKVLASAAAPTAKPGAWLKISVTASGSKLRATLDDGAPLEATDATYASGWTGFWTKGAAESSFDDWKAAPAK